MKNKIIIVSFVILAFSLYLFLESNILNKASTSIRLAETNSTTINKDSKKYYNVLDYGIKKGKNDTLAQTNSNILMKIIERTKNNNKTIYFPDGDYTFDVIDIGENNNISFLGEGSVNVYFDTKEKEVFKQKASMIYIDKINFYATLGNDKKHFFNTGGAVSGSSSETCSNDTKNSSYLDYRGKFFISNSSFNRFINVFGGTESTQLGVIQHESNCMQKSNSFSHSVLLADNVVFKDNIIALSQLVDSRIINSRFDNNDYAIFFPETSGMTTISNNTFNNSNQSNIYIGKTKFDRVHTFYKMNNKEIESAHEIIISNNTFNNQKSGIVIEGYNYNQSDGKNIKVYPKNIVIRDNKFNGILNKTISGNQIINNTNLYIYLSKALDVVITNNKSDYDSILMYIERSERIISQNNFKANTIYTLYCKKKDSNDYYLTNSNSKVNDYGLVKWKVECNK